MTPDRSFMHGWDAARGLTDETIHRSNLQAMIRKAWQADDMRTVTRLVKQGAAISCDISISSDGSIYIHDDGDINAAQYEAVLELCPWMRSEEIPMPVAERETEDTRREREDALEALKRGDVL